MSTPKLPQSCLKTNSQGCLHPLSLAYPSPSVVFAKKAAVLIPSLAPVARTTVLLSRLWGNEKELIVISKGTLSCCVV